MFILTYILFLTILLAGCANSQQIAQKEENSSWVQIEETPDTKSALSSETENNISSGQSEAQSISSGEISESYQTQNEANKGENTKMQMNVQIGSRTFTATLENNTAVDALVEMMKNGPVVIQMSDYSGFEKVGSLQTSFPSSNSQINAQPGDIMLYNENQIVIFYGSNTWSYTKIGRINDLSGWEAALGTEDVTVTFSLKE